MSWLLVWPILVPLATAGLCLLVWRAPGVQRLLSLVGLVVLVVGDLLLLDGIWAQGPQAVQASSWAAPYGITLVADLLSAILVLLTGLIGLGVVVYAFGDLDIERETTGFHPMLHALLTGVGGAFITGDIFNLYVWFEVMVIASFGLIALGGARTQVDGSVKYVVLNLIATTVLLIAIGLLYGVTGTLNMADLSRVVPSHPDQGLLMAIAAMFLLAFGMKAAVFPLYFWLPASYHTPSAAVSAVFAGLLTKVGVYALIRVFTLIFSEGQGYTYGAILLVGALTMLVGVLGAIAQSDLRRVLSFNLVSGIGFILVGIGLGTALGLAGALYYTVHHIVVMAGLFMAAGVVQRWGGAQGLDRLGGFYVKEPWMAVLFFVVAMSLAGVPPLSGFWPKVIVVQASLAAESYIIAAAALVTGFLTLYSMAKVWALAFWRSAPDSGDAALVETGAAAVGAAPAVERRALLMAPVAVLAAASVAIGLWAQPLLSLSQRAAAGLIAPDAYVAAVLGDGAAATGKEE
jgi:multicomponent Na+:H+ antiporter subunit D